MMRGWYKSPKIAVALIAVLVFLVAVACGSSATAPTSAPAAAATGTPVPQAVATQPPAATGAEPMGILNIGYKELGAYNAHPRTTQGQQGLFVGSSVTESLVMVTPDAKFAPKIAKEWSVSEDTLTWTFKLNQGIQFHKGYGELTAEDVIWSVRDNTAHDESVSASNGNYKRLWKAEGGSVTQVDDHTIEIHTGTPQYDMLNWMSKPYTALITSKAQWDAEGEEGSRVGVGSGAWEISESRSGELWRFDAVADHYRKTPNFSELIFWEIPEESTRVANFQAGKLDTFVMALDSLPAIETVRGVKFMRLRGAGTVHLGFYGNWYVGHGTDKQMPGYDGDLPWVSSNPDPNSEEWDKARKVREALSISIDRQLIVDELLKGEGSPLVLWGWEEHIDRLKPQHRQWEYNVERAKQLLAEAGYKDGFEVDFTPDIRGIPAEVEATEAIATMWEEIGVKAKLFRVPYDTIAPQIRARTYNGLNTHGTGGRIDPLGLLNQTIVSGKGFTGGSDHPIMDEWVLKANGILDEGERYEELVELAGWVYDNVMEAGIYQVNFVWPLSEKIDGWPEHLELGDRRVLTGLEWVPHRQ